MTTLSLPCCIRITKPESDYDLIAEVSGFTSRLKVGVILIPPDSTRQNTVGLALEPTLSSTTSVSGSVSVSGSTFNSPAGFAQKVRLNSILFHSGKRVIDLKRVLLSWKAIVNSYRISSCK